MRNYCDVDLWSEFISAFKDTLPLIERRQDVFESRTLRSEVLFGENGILDSIAKNLGLFIAKERPFRFDAVMYAKGSFGWAVPLIFVESENDYNSADREIEKLMPTSAPLKVLFLKTDESYDNLTNEWIAYNVSDFKEVYKLHGTIGLIVFRSNKTISFFNYDESGVASPEKNFVID